MKSRLCSVGIVLIGCAAALGCVTTYPYYQTVPMGGQATPPAAVLEDNGSDQPFYDDLTPYGRWVNVSGPGWVWSPNASIQTGWRPYQIGHWVYTDYGWTWSSDESWGWAVYHHGRWHQDARYGWVWVPGTEWGPAWVAWQEGGGYVGWAPLPWNVRVQAGVGIVGASLNVSISPNWWCFVGARNLVDIDVRTRIVPQARNVNIIQVTRNVTNYTYIDNRIINNSVRIETINRAVGRTIPRYRLSEATDVAESVRGGKVKGQELIMYRPDPRGGRNSRGQRAVPPGHSEEMERVRQMRHGVTPPVPDGPDAPPQVQNTQPPAVVPPEQPADDHGRNNQNRGRKPHENRGRKFLEALTGQQPPPQRGRPPQANRPQEPPPAAPPSPDQPVNAVNPPAAPASQPSNTPAPSVDARAGRPAPADQHVVSTPPGRAESEREKADRDRKATKDAAEAAVKARKVKQDPPKHHSTDDDDSKKEGGSNSGNHNH